MYCCPHCARKSGGHHRTDTPSRGGVEHLTMDTPTMSSGSHGEQAKRTFAAALRFAGVIVTAAMGSSGVGTAMGEWLQVRDR